MSDRRSVWLFLLVASLVYAVFGTWMGWTTAASYAPKAVERLVGAAMALSLHWAWSK